MGWEPPIGVCRSEMELQRPNLTILDPVFCIPSLSTWIRRKSFFLAPIFTFLGVKKTFFWRLGRISRNGAVQPNFWKSHSANMKPDCRKYLQAIIVAVDKETNLPVFSSTSGEKVWWKHHLCHPKTDFSQLSEVQSENDSGWLCFRAMSLKRTCCQRRRTWWRARRSWTRSVEKAILIWRGRCDDGGRRQERQWEFF